MEHLQEEETSKCVDGRRLRVARQTRRAKIETDGKEAHMDLLIAKTTQKVILGYDLLQRSVKSRDFKGGKVTFRKERPETAEEQEGVGAEL